MQISEKNGGVQERNRREKDIDGSRVDEEYYEKENRFVKL